MSGPASSSAAAAGRGEWSPTIAALSEITSELVSARRPGAQQVIAPADIATVAALVDAALAELRARGTAAYLAEPEAVQTVVIALSIVGKRHLAVARTCAEILRIVCSDALGLVLASCDVLLVVFSRTTGAMGGINCSARSALLGAVMGAHKDDARFVEDAAAALTFLMGCPLSPEKELLEAKFGASADTVFWIAMDRMFDHTANAAVAQQLLRLALATKPSAARRDAIVAGGGGDIPGMTMSHHITNRTIVRDAAALMHRMLAAPGAARRLDGAAAACLGSALHYNFVMDRDAAAAAAAGEPEAADVTCALMRTLTRLLEGGSVALWGRLTEGISYAQLVDGMRKDMANVSTAAAACRLLALIAAPSAGSPARVSQLVHAAAVPLLADILVLHAEEPEVAAAAAAANALLAVAT